MKYYIRQPEVITEINSLSTLAKIRYSNIVASLGTTDVRTCSVFEYVSQMYQNYLSLFVVYNK